MKYPHRKYLLFLLSRQMNANEVRAECMARSLMPPNDASLEPLVKELGTPPKCWRAVVTQDNVGFRRWLRDQGLLTMWVQDAVSKAAIHFLYKIAIREDFEAVMLIHGDVAQARQELLVKYPEAMVPEVKVLERYQEYFWDVGHMQPDEVFDFLSAKENADKYLPAMQGDLIEAYGVLGLQQKVDGEVFLRNVIEMANQQVARARAGSKMSGQLAAGVSRLIGLGMDANRDLQELHGATEADTGLRKEAATFMARVIQRRAIPSYDELDSDNAEVIDVEYAEAGNVHQLPRRRE